MTSKTVAPFALSNKRMHHFAPLVSLTLLALAFCGSLSAQTTRPTSVAHSASPDGAMAITLITNEQQRIAGLQLIATSGSPVSDLLAADPKSSRMKADQVHSSVLWCDDNSAVAIALTNGTDSEIYSFVRTGKTFTGDNITAYSGGSLPIASSEIVRNEHTPMSWARSSQGWLVWVRKRSWDKKGQRYTTKEPVWIRSDGKGTGR